MSYKDYIIAAALDLDVIQDSDSSGNFVSHGVDWDNNNIIKTGTDVTYAIDSDMQNRAVFLEKKAQVRSDRTSLLADTDWTILSDNSLSDSDRQKWQTYRQQLRDAPSTIVEGSEDDFRMPQHPFVT